MKPVVIVVAGSGAHARVLLDACREAAREIAGWIDAGACRETLAGSAPLGGEHLLAETKFLARHELAIGVGNEARRRALAGQVLNDGGTLATIIHPSSVVARSATIGTGSALLATSVVGVEARVGRFCIINTAATVDHDCDLADGVNLCPGVHLSGAVRCGADAFIGTGASVLPGIRIGARAIIGAGAVVIADVSDGQTVAGVPARPIERTSR